jgi:tetratricopeptide (TPR) repeat protein
VSDDSAVRSEQLLRATACLERGYRLALAGDFDAAIPEYRRSIGFVPTGGAHTLLASALARTGRVDEAIAECREAIRLDPDFGNAWSDLGAYYLEKGETDCAARCLLRATGKKRFERSHTVHANLGRAHWRQGLLMKALGELRAAVSLEPRDLPAKKSIREILRNFN